MPQQEPPQTLEQYYSRRRTEQHVRETTMPGESTRVDLENVPRGRERYVDQTTPEERPSILERGIRFGAEGVDYFKRKRGELDEYFQRKDLEEREYQRAMMSPEEYEEWERQRDTPPVEIPTPIPWWLMVGGAGGGAGALGTTSGIARSTTVARALGRRSTGEALSRASQQGAARSIPTERAAISALQAERATIQAEQAEMAAEAARVARASMEAERAAQISGLASPTRTARSIQAARSPQSIEAARTARSTERIATARGAQAAHLTEKARGSAQVAEMVEATREFSPLYQQGVRLGKNITGTPLNPSELSRLMSTLPNEMARNEIRLGMLEGFKETIANSPRVSRITQQHLLSPAGKAMLRETLAGMPDDMFRDFMLMVERGKWTEIRNWTIKIAAAIPILRYAGGRVWRSIIGAGE